ncbi:UNVERIFIED_CONTAM: hypothetical protein GTU68_028132 [Idotea baltica]|nr:hypothetical protein [Idotea baltica]
MTYGSVIYGICTFLMPFPAPYGRYGAKWAGFGVPAKLAWLIQEIPSFVVPLILALYGSRNESFRSLSNQLCVGMFMLHYFQRSLIYPVLMKSKEPTPFLPFVAAFLTCLYNGILHGFYFVSYQSYSDSDWLMKPYFWLGFLMFLYGMNVNIESDSILRNLRKGNSKEYKIPKGF